jgi:excisionase family DNA binding protein
MSTLTAVRRADDSSISPTNPPQYVRPRDVVRITDLSESTIFNALASGELRAFRRGRAWLVPVEAVRAWIEADASDETPTT